MVQELRCPIKLQSNVSSTLNTHKTGETTNYWPTSIELNAKVNLDGNFIRNKRVGNNYYYCSWLFLFYSVNLYQSSAFAFQELQRLNPLLPRQSAGPWGNGDKLRCYVEIRMTDINLVYKNTLNAIKLNHRPFAP